MEPPWRSMALKTMMMMSKRKYWKNQKIKFQIKQKSLVRTRGEVNNNKLYFAKTINKAKLMKIIIQNHLYFICLNPNFTTSPVRSSTVST